MERTFRCNCPITSALDILGDKWMLVIVKQMLIDDKITFKDFIESEEAIASNILAAKLKLLEQVGIITKSQLPGNKKTNLYHLTDMGLSLTPIIVELSVWSEGNLKGLNPIMRNNDQIEFIKSHKEAFIQMVIDNYKSKRL